MRFSFKGLYPAHGRHTLDVIACGDSLCVNEWLCCFLPSRPWWLPIRDTTPNAAAQWEKEIAGIEKRQRTKPPAKGGIVFAGSSTIRMWDTAKGFPGWHTANSGFGGSEIRDVTHFADRIILKHEPRAIVFYAGDNDVNSRRSPEQVFSDYKAFVAKIHKRLPKTRLYFVSIKPSILRWKQYATQTKANKLVKDYCASDDRLAYIDIVAQIARRQRTAQARVIQGGRTAPVRQGLQRS